MQEFRNCEVCGIRFEYKPYIMKPELCTPCWDIPDYIPEEQREMYYRLLKERYEKSKHKKMLLLRQTNS